MNRGTVLLGLLVGLTWGGAVGGNEPVSRAAPAAGVQDLVFFSESRPLLIRMHVTIDGQPFRAVWDQFIQGLFKAQDADGDGSLNKEEAEKTLPIGALLVGDLSGATTQGVSFRTLDRNPRDDKVSLQEFREYYDQTGGSFQLQFTSPTGQPISGDSINDLLFKRLDSDGDGKLSRDELAKVATALQRFDADDDEVISAGELDPRLVGGEAQVPADEMPAARKPAPVKRSLLLIGPSENAASWVQEILNRYARSDRKLKDRTVTREEIGLDAASFQRLDQDSDGELNRDELELFSNRPAEFEILVQLGSLTPGQQRLSAYHDKDRPAILNESIQKASGDRLILKAGSSLVELRCNDFGPQQQKLNAGLTKRVTTQQFKSLDRDNNGYLEEGEVAEHPVYSKAFKKLDKDGDGKLFEKEFLEEADRQIEKQAQATTSRVLLSITDQGKGLFDLLDANHDGRLSLRELRQASTLAAAADRDRDGYLALTEIPQTHQATVNRNPSSGNIGRRAIVVATGMAGGPPPAAAAPGPLWFQKMDRNRDGDISPREFLGPSAEFRKIDTDGDGLISAEEAQKADAAHRKATGG